MSPEAWLGPVGSVALLAHQTHGGVGPAGVGGLEPQVVAAHTFWMSLPPFGGLRGEGGGQ